VSFSRDVLGTGEDAWDRRAIVVDKMGLNWMNALITRLIFRHMLLKRACTKPEFERLLAGTKFKRAEVIEKPIELPAWLWK